VKPQAPPDVLAEIVATARRRVVDATVPNQRFSSALRHGSDSGQVSLISEHKRASPSAGVIRDDLALSDVVRAYADAGAAALSILTEPSRFSGRLTDIIEARALTELPILRKDFIVEPYQLYEASVAGADAILLIVAAFPDQPAQLAGLNRLAAELGLEVLMEVHNAGELEVALELEAPIIGINNRNLATLEVDLQTTYELRAQIPADTIAVAESGFSTREQVRELAAAGIDAVLMGEALMRAPDITAAARAIVTATAERRR
jgi:indole-3-glycerol phosphate synthase